MSDTTCHCGGKISKQQAKDRTFLFGEYGRIRLAKSLKLNTCDNCNDYYLDGDEAALDAALTSSLASNTVEILGYIKKTHEIPEKHVAHFCGLTAESLSRCKNEASGKVISAPAFKLLTGLANKGVRFMTEYVGSDHWRDRGNSSSSGNGSGNENGAPLAAKSN